MNLKTDGKVTTKIFAGCLVNAEMKMHLGQSSTWKQVAIMPREGSEELLEVHYHGKVYLGMYLPEDKATLKKLRSIEESIKERMNAYLSDFDVGGVKVSVFCQVFVA